MTVSPRALARSTARRNAVASRPRAAASPGEFFPAVHTDEWDWSANVSAARNASLVPFTVVRNGRKADCLFRPTPTTGMGLARWAASVSRRPTGP